MEFMKVMLSAFWMIFIAELGDKTQLATISMAAKTNMYAAVFAGSALALAASAALGVSLGSALSSIFPEWIIKCLAGASFIIFGIITLSGAVD